jgi:diguanylate cyclase (GGDEF)-like protein
MLGFGEQDLTDSPEEWLSRVCEPDQTRLRAAIAAHLGSGAAEWECEYRVARRDGGVRWMRSRAVCSRDRTGSAIRLTGSQADVTAAATTDALTGLYSRAYLVSEIDRAISDPGRPPYAMLILDVDSLPLVNESLGRHAGERLLKEIAERLRSVCGGFVAENDRLRIEPARVGGDAFAVLIVGEHQKVPIDLAARFKQDLAGPFDVEGRDVFSGVSIGLVNGNPSYGSAEEVLRDADTAMNGARRNGAGRVQVFDPAMRASALARLELETGLRRALDRGEMTLYFQPKVDLKTEAVTAFEALLRWADPERGIVGPNEFIRVAEETGLIIPLGMWALTEGCRQMQEWCAEYPLTRGLALSVNLSLQQFSEPDLCDGVRRILDETRFNPDRLNLEITESVLAGDLNKTRETLDRLKAMKIGLKLDDFGTGYSSLSYLCHLPFDTLKIDRSFVSGMAASRETADIVRTIIALANDLHMDVIAEGIEQREEMVALRDLGCQSGQGFYFGHPLPPHEIEEQFLAGRNGTIVLPSVSNGHQSYRY